MLENKIDVIQSNKLIFAKHKLSLHALRFVIIAASKISRDDKEFKKYEISVKEMSAILGVSNGAHLYKALDRATDEILQTIIRIRGEEGETKYTLASSAQYVEKAGIVRFSFHPDMTDLLLELKENFTRYDLRNVIFLSTGYGIRLFEILKSKEFRNYFECSIEELKELLGIEKDKYNVYGNFNSRVLRPSVFSINESTDIKVTYKEIKTGRKVTGLAFDIHSQKIDLNQKNLTLEVLDGVISQTENATTIKRLQEYGLNKKQAEKIVLEHSNQYILENLDEVDRRKKTQDIQSLNAYTLAAIKDDYAQATRLNVQEKNNKQEIREQRQQDDIEKQLQAEKEKEKRAEAYLTALYEAVAFVNPNYQNNGADFRDTADIFTKSLIQKSQAEPTEYEQHILTKSAFAQYLAKKYLPNDEQWHSLEAWEMSK